jgi:hypothetical protein
MQANASKSPTEEAIERQTVKELECSRIFVTPSASCFGIPDSQ